MKTFVATLSFILLVGGVLAQKKGRAKLDSLRGSLTLQPMDTQRVNTLNALAFAYYNVDADSGLLFANEALTISKQLKFPKGEALANRRIGESYIPMADYPKSLEYLLLALQQYREMNNDNGLAATNLALSMLYRKLDDKPKALEYALNALRVRERLKEKKALANACNNVGMSYEVLGKPDSALVYYSRGLKLFRELNDLSGTAMITMNIGVALADKKDFREALKYHYEAAEVQKLLKDNVGMANSTMNIAQAYLGLAKDSVTKYPADSLSDRKRLLEKAEVLSLRAVEMFKEAGHVSALANALQTVVSVKRAMGRSEEALTMYIAADKLEDSLLSQQNLQQMAASSERYESNLKQKEIELQKLRLATAEQQRWFLIIGFVLIALLAVVLFNRYRLKQRAERQLEMENVRSRISRDLHDDIGSTLSSINILMHSARKRLVEKELDKTSESLEKIQERTRRALDNMSDIVWNIKPQNDTLVEVLARMREYASAVLDAKNIVYTIDFPDIASNFVLPLDLKNSMYLVFKEAVNNLAKHSDCSDAKLTLNVNNSRLQLVIKDNGKGLDENARQGNGLENMRRRAVEVGADFNVSSDGKGTVVTFAARIPKTSDTRAAVGA